MAIGKRESVWVPWFVAAATVALFGGVSFAFFRPSESRPVRRPPPEEVRNVRGMVVSCPIYGQIWASDAMRKAVAELRTLGVDWVQIHPYASIDEDGTVGYRPADFVADGFEIIREAGLAPFSKPHLAYWGSFEWRGAIRFDTQPQWRRFFSTYRKFILAQAEIAEASKVPLFAVGTELDATLEHEKQWRKIIADVRKVYSGQLTYAANWDAVEKVPFWDALDLVGVQAYFPVGPAEARGPALRAGVRGWLDRLGALSTKTGRPVLLAEVGYARSKVAPSEPWKPSVDSSPEAIRLRTELTRLVLEESQGRPWLLGMFWWKWIPGWNLWDRDFSMRDPEMKAALRAAWTESSPGQPSSRKAP